MGTSIQLCYMDISKCDVLVLDMCDIGVSTLAGHFEVVSLRKVDESETWTHIGTQTCTQVHVT